MIVLINSLHTPWPENSFLRLSEAAERFGHIDYEHSELSDEDDMSANNLPEEEVANV